MTKQKTIPQLETEKAENERKISQLQHKKRQLENRITYYEKGDRRKRAHRLITRGAAIESVAQLAKALTETEFYAFAEKVFDLSEVKGLLTEAVNEHNRAEREEVLSIALFHFHVTQIKRSAGQSAVASAAYRAGEKLHSEYYGEDNDYTRKGGVICSEILLLSHAPPEYADRETLWNAEEKAELAKPQPPTLNDLLALHCANRNKGAYSNKAKNANLQRYAEAFSFLQSKNLYTVDDLESTLYAMQNKIDTLKKSASAKQARIKEVDELLRMVDYYESGKPAADKLKSIRFEKSRQKYKSEHDNELRTFYMAERKLKPYFKDGKLPITAWRREREQLEQEYKEIQSELSPLHADAKKPWAIHYNIYEVQHEQEHQNAATRQKKQEIEH